MSASSIPSNCRISEKGSAWELQEVRNLRQNLNRWMLGLNFPERTALFRPPHEDISEELHDRG